jgi:hypothetical protein
MTRKKALEQWGNHLGNCEVTPKAIWPPVKPLIKRDGPKTPTAIHGPLGLKYQPPDKATTMRIVWKINLHHMTRVMKTINGRWRLELKRCLKLETTSRYTN